MGAEESKPAETGTDEIIRGSKSKSSGRNSTDILSTPTKAGSFPKTDDVGQQSESSQVNSAHQKESAYETDPPELVAETNGGATMRQLYETASSVNNGNSGKRPSLVDVDLSDNAAEASSSNHQIGSDNGSVGPLPNGVALNLNSPMVTIMKKSLSPSSSHEHYFLSPTNSDTPFAATALERVDSNQSKRRNILPKPPSHSGSTPSVNTSSRGRNNVWSITKDMKTFYGWGNGGGRDTLENRDRQKENGDKMEAPVRELTGESDSDAKKKLFAEEGDGDKNNTYGSLDSDDVQEEQMKDFSTTSSCESGLWNAAKKAAHMTDSDDDDESPPKSIDCPLHDVATTGEEGDESDPNVSRLNSPTSGAPKHIKDSEVDEEYEDCNKNVNTETTPAVAAASPATTNTSNHGGMNGFTDVSRKQDLSCDQVAVAAATAAAVMAVTTTNAMRPNSFAKEQNVNDPLDPSPFSRRNTDVASNITGSRETISETNLPSTEDLKEIATRNSSSKSRISVRGPILVLTIISLLSVRYHSFMRSLSALNSYIELGEIEDEITLQQQQELYRKEELAGYAFVGLSMTGLFIVVSIKIQMLRFAFASIKRGKHNTSCWGLIQVMIGLLTATSIALMDIIIVYYFLFEFNESMPQIDLM